MTTATDILDQALNLPDTERALIAERLIFSLDPATDPEVELELAWQEEVKKRLAQIDRDKVQCVPWEEVRDRLRGKYRAQG